MENLSFQAVWKQDRPGTTSWLLMEAVALSLGMNAAVMIVRGHVEIVALVLYGVATLASIRAGGDIANRVAQREVARRKIVGLLNDDFHKWCVVALNGIVFAALCARAYLEARSMKPYSMALCTVLLIAAGVYLWSSNHLVHPHSVMARFRSALLRAFIMTMLAGLVWGPFGLLGAAVVTGSLLPVTWKHLVLECARWKWPPR